MASERQTGEPAKGGDEHDTFSRWRRFLSSRPGRHAAAKRSYNRRVRRQAVAVSDE